MFKIGTITKLGKIKDIIYDNSCYLVAWENYLIVLPTYMVEDYEKFKEEK